jgi:hypothetical protein
MMMREIGEMHKINSFGKIVVGNKEVYYGYIQSIDYEKQTAKLMLIDWRDKDQSTNYAEMDCPINNFTIKYEGEEQ